MYLGPTSQLHLPHISLLKICMFFSRCDEPVTVSINVKVKGEDIDWTYVFTSGDEQAVPGLGIDIKDVAKAGLFIKVTIEQEDSKLTLKVRLTQMLLFISNYIKKQKYRCLKFRNSRNHSSGF